MNEILPHELPDDVLSQFFKILCQRWVDIELQSQFAAFLAKTAGANPVRNFTQKLPHPDNKTFLGKGKIRKYETIWCQD